MPKVRTVAHGRIKERYNPVPTVREKAYHIWLIETFGCICGCDGASEVVHHPLTRHPEQRWRRDHEFVVPMTAQHHIDLHLNGNERDWRPNLPLDQLANWFRSLAIEERKL
jgi:hypothetical protein